MMCYFIYSLYKKAQIFQLLLILDFKVEKGNVLPHCGQILAVHLHHPKSLQKVNFPQNSFI